MTTQSRKWTRPEEEVLNRHVDALIRGGYSYIADAARACADELARLSHRRRWTAPARTLEAVTPKVRQRLLASRVLVCGTTWTAPEQQVLARYALALARRAYSASNQAVADCTAEFARRHATQPQAFARRPRGAVKQRILLVARGLGWTGAGSQVCAPEERLLMRYARGVAAGRFSSAQRAADACVLELAGLRERLPQVRPKTVDTVVTYLRRRMIALGHRAGAPRWSRTDADTARRYARGIAEGRYASAKSAAYVCVGERRTKRPVGRASPGELMRFERRIGEEATKLGIPRPDGHWTDQEEQIIRRFADAVARGTYAGPQAALDDCLSALARSYIAIRAQRHGEVRAVGGRTRLAVNQKLTKLVQKLGRHRAIPQWGRPESRAFRSWLRWYARHRVPPKRGPLKQATDGLQEKLAGRGFRRSSEACESRLLKGYRRLRGMA